MGTEGSSRSGASHGARLRSSFRLKLGEVEFELMPGGWVRVTTDMTREYDSLGAFLAAMRAMREVSGATMGGA